MRRKLFQVVLLLIVLIPARLLEAATYYVDFDNGSDTNSGISTALAWKRSPGDPQAGGTARNTTLVPGDSVLFRGGVSYRGSVEINANGTAATPIIFKGDGWGSERAQLEGSDSWTPTWTRCLLAADCASNPNFDKIYYATAPIGYSNFQTALYEDGRFLWYAQSPNPSDPFYHDDLGSYYVIPQGSTTIRQTRTTLTDPRVFTQSDQNFWNDAYIITWINGNVTQTKKISGFNPATDTITYEDLGGEPYTDRDSYYSLLNHRSLIDQPGEYAYVAGENRIYLRPLDSDQPASHMFSVAARGTALHGPTASNIVVEGFKVQHYVLGIRFENDRGTSSGLTIRNNEVSMLRSENWYAVQVSANNSIVENNRVENCHRAVAILLSGGPNIIVRNNFVRRTSRQGIWFMGVTNGQIVHNTVTDMRGTHSNGISIYQGSADVLMAHNTITNANSPLTYERSSNLTFFNNLIDAAEGSANSNDWGGTSGKITFVNNTFVRNSRNAAIALADTTAQYIVINNIIDGGTGGTHNIYTGLAWSQDIRYGWSLGANEIVETDLTKIFVDPAQGNWRLKETSPAVNQGTDPVAYLPKSQFPNYDFGVDLEGKPRVQSGQWDMGAYEFGTSVIAPMSAPTNFRINQP